jgi:hypothetical protein
MKEYAERWIAGTYISDAQKCKMTTDILCALPKKHEAYIMYM